MRIMGARSSEGTLEREREEVGHQEEGRLLACVVLVTVTVYKACLLLSDGACNAIHGTSDCTGSLSSEGGCIRFTSKVIHCGRSNIMFLGGGGRRG